MTLPLTTEAFRRGLYAEHLEDASFLWAQRAALLQQPGLDWSALAALEARLEAHLDALVLGGPAALAVCRDVPAGGDAGELFAAVSVCCRALSATTLAELFRHMDLADPLQVQAVVDAMRVAWPQGWQGFLDKHLREGDERLIPVLARVAGYRRLPMASALLAAWQRLPAQSEIFVEQLGCLRAQEALLPITRCFQRGDARLREAALLALLRCGVPDGPAMVQRAQRDQPVSWSLAALGCGVELLPALCQALNGELPEARDAAMALGLLGSPQALSALHASLSRPELAQTAAWALIWMTGAALVQTELEPEEVDELILFPQELQVWRQYKEAPKRLDGQAFGEQVTKPCTDPDIWRQWLTQHASAWDPALRYRAGRPIDPAVLRADLARPDRNLAQRRWTALELEIRHGLAGPYEPDLPVFTQQAMVQAMAQARSASSAVPPGRWCYGGQGL